MPGAVPMTSSYALNNATLPFGLALANKGLDAIRENVHLQNGLNVHRGMITNEAVAQSLKKKMVAPLDALKVIYWAVEEFAESKGNDQTLGNPESAENVVGFFIPRPLRSLR